GEGRGQQAGGGGAGRRGAPADPRGRREKGGGGGGGGRSLPPPTVHTPSGIRTRAAGVKGRCPRPLDDGGRSTQDSRVERMTIVIRRGSWDDFDAVYELTATTQSRPEHLRWLWDLPSFEPERHLWLAEDDGRLRAFG